MKTVVVIAILAPALHAQTLSQGTFITRLGTDTLAMESFTRTKGEILGAIVWRSPAFGGLRYRVELNPDGSAAKATSWNLLSATDRDRLYPFDSAQVRFTRDSAFLTFPSTVRNRAVVTPLSGFVANYSWALMEQVLAQNPPTGDSVRRAITGVTASGLYAANTYTKRITGDTVQMAAINAVGPIYIKIDAASRILGGDARKSTSKYTVERTGRQTDIAVVASKFLVAERNGHAFGSVIATRDTARLSLGTLAITVDYTRPRLHGRRVFVGGVLGDTLWRTGANRATHLTLSRDIRLGGTVIPAGTYTLYTSIAPDNSTYTLILSAQTGQWGTVYDVTRDVARVPLRVRHAPTTEYFTIALRAGSGTRGELTLTWDTTELSVPVEIP